MSDETNRLSVGKKLQEARQAKNLTLDDIQQKTKIQKRYLIAIEDGKYDQLPGDFYVRAFVKQYAESVGLNGEELLNEFNDDLPDPNKQEYVEKKATAPESRAGQFQPDERAERIRRLTPPVLIGVVILLVLGLIWYFAAHNSANKSGSIDSSSISVSGESSSKKTTKTTKKHSSTKTKSADKVKLEKVSDTGANAVYSAESVPNDFEIELDGSNVWASAMVDGKSQFSGTLAADKKQTIKVAKGAKTVKVTLGNAQKATVKINGEELTIPSEYKSGLTVRNITINLGTTTTATNSSSGATNRTQE